MHYELDNETNFANLFTNFSKGYKYAESDRYSLTSDFIYELNKQHLLSAGFLYDYFDIIPRGPDLPQKYNTSCSPGGQNLCYPNTTLAIDFFENSYENVGVYVQDNWEIDESWRVVAGIRYDHSSFYERSVSPRLSAICKYNEKNVIKLLYGHSFLSPAPNQAFTSFGSFDGNQNNGLWTSVSGAFGPIPFRVPNEELEPERLRMQSTP